MNRKIGLLTCTLCIIAQINFSQKILEREIHSFTQEISNVKSLVLQGNKIKTIIYNTGSVSNPGVTGNVLDLTWHGLGYAYEIGFLAGARVPSNTSGDSVNIIIDGFGSANKSTADGDFAPDGVSKWGWLPLPGYAKENQNDVANNQNLSTWPESWTVWNGKYGNPIAELESYYMLTDSSDKEFPYYPYTNDSSKQGLGLQVAVRHYLFVHPNLEDMLLTTYDIKNVSDKNLPAVVSGIFGDPHIGGANNYADDATNFDPVRNLIYSWDPDNKSDIPALSPGYFGTMFTETPHNNGLTSYASFIYGGVYRPKNDSLIYSMMSPGIFTKDLFNPPTQNLGDYVMLLGTGYFSLGKSETQSVGVAYIFAENLTELLSKTDLIEQEYRTRFGAKGNPIALSSPAINQTIVSDNIQIQWNTQPLDNDTTIDLFYSNTYDQKWHPIASHIPNNGSYTWNITNIPDGIFHKVHILNDKVNTISYDSTKGFFTINRAGDASPEIVALPLQPSPLSGTFPIRWVAGDAEEDPVTINIYLSENDGATYGLVGTVNNSGLYLFDSKKVANTRQAKIKLEAFANGKSTAIETKTFRIANFFFALTDTTTYKHISGSGTGMVFPGIADSSVLTGNTYRITFDSSYGSLRYNLKNITTTQIKLTKEPLTSITGSGTLADGLRIWFKNDLVGLDSTQSSFTSPLNNISVKFDRPTFGTVYYAPVDIKIEFASLDTNAAGNYLFPLDSAGTTNPTLKTVKIPFKVSLINDTTAVQILVKDNPIKGKLLRWDFGEEIIILTPPQYRKVANNTHAGIIFTKINPSDPSTIPSGAIYVGRSTKPFTIGDAFEFMADVQYGKATSIPRDGQTPKYFSLEQNYPNPFNPETRIRFSIAQKGMTTLKIFDAIGREVQTLIDDELSQGVYLEIWNGKNRFNQAVSSGVYFFRLQSGSFTQAKKMILMR